MKEAEEGQADKEEGGTDEEEEEAGDVEGGWGGGGGGLEMSLCPRALRQKKIYADRRPYSSRWRHPLHL